MHIIKNWQFSEVSESGLNCAAAYRSGPPVVARFRHVTAFFYTDCRSCQGQKNVTFDGGLLNVGVY